MAGLLTLNQPVEVRILCPQPDKIAHFMGNFVFKAPWLKENGAPCDAPSLFKLYS
jgi:hypothetical protein